MLPEGATATRLFTDITIPAPIHVSGVWHKQVEWTPRAVIAGRLETILDAMADATNGLRVISDGTTVYIEKLITGVSEMASLTITPVKDTTYLIDGIMLSDNTLSVKVDGVAEDTNTSTTGAGADEPATGQPAQGSAEIVIAGIAKSEVRTRTIGSASAIRSEES